MNQKYLKSILVYNPKFGIFYWKVDKGTAKSGSIAGSINKVSGYRQIRINNVSYLEHRLVFLYVCGKFPDDQVDHINRDKVDNRFINLRECSAAENLWNVKHIKGGSKFFGVGFHKKSNKWVARIRDGFKQIHIGLFTDEIEAAKAYDKAALEIHGSFATVNFS